MSPFGLFFSDEDDDLDRAKTLVFSRDELDLARKGGDPLSTRKSHEDDLEDVKTVLLERKDLQAVLKESLRESREEASTMLFASPFAAKTKPAAEQKEDVFVGDDVIVDDLPNQKTMIFSVPEMNPRGQEMEDARTRTAPDMPVVNPDQEDEEAAEDDMGSGGTLVMNIGQSMKELAQAPREDDVASASTMIFSPADFAKAAQSVAASSARTGAEPEEERAPDGAKTMVFGAAEVQDAISRYKDAMDKKPDASMTMAFMPVQTGLSVDEAIARMHESTDEEPLAQEEETTDPDRKKSACLCRKNLLTAAGALVLLGAAAALVAWLFDWL